MGRDTLEKRILAIEEFLNEQYGYETEESREARMQNYKKLLDKARQK